MHPVFEHPASYARAHSSVSVDSPVSEYRDIGAVVSAFSSNPGDSSFVQTPGFIAALDHYLPSAFLAPDGGLWSSTGAPVKLFARPGGRYLIVFRDLPPMQCNAVVESLFKNKPGSPFTIGDYNGIYDGGTAKSPCGVEQPYLAVEGHVTDKIGD